MNTRESAERLPFPISSYRNNRSVLEKALNCKAALFFNPETGSNVLSEEYSSVAEKFKQRFLPAFKKVLKDTAIIVPLNAAFKTSKKLVQKFSEEALMHAIKDNANSIGLNGEKVVNELAKIAKPLKKFIMLVGLSIKIANGTDLSREEIVDVIFKEVTSALKSKAVSMMAQSITMRLLPEILVGAVSLGLSVVIKEIFTSPSLNVGEEQELKRIRLEDAQKKQEDFLREYGRRLEDIPSVQSEAQAMFKKNSMKMGGRGK